MLGVRALHNVLLIAAGRKLGRAQLRLLTMGVGVRDAGPGSPAVGPPLPSATSAPMLGAADAVDLLMTLGLLAPADLVAGLTVTDASRRNRNHRVVCEAGRSYLIKQAGDPDKVRTLANEAEIYRLLAAHASDAVRAALPAIVRYFDDGILVLELDAAAVSLAAYHRTVRRFPPGMAATLGRTVAALHATSGDDVRRLAPVADGLPLVFSFDRPDVTVYYGASGATLQLLTAIHATGDFAARLGDLRDDWTAGTMIHADLRLDNCIVRPSERVRTGKHLRLVDWEMAMWGDPAWDLATLLSEYLSLWIDHAPVSEATPPEQFLDHGVFTLDRLQPSIRHLWDAYRDARTMSEPPWLLWERAVRFSAARLVQTAYETSQYLNELSGQVVFKLQLAHNILTDPITASTVLLGIPAGGRAS